MGNGLITKAGTIGTGPPNLGKKNNNVSTLSIDKFNTDQLLYTMRCSPVREGRGNHEAPTQVLRGQRSNSIVPQKYN
ncbi:hypothetical protein TNCV_3939561 [Trichonephila clavipes]|uniref:Uncharacterized protein n=1 Tax=Trichonephila clavipes TaxID=2585209 RepID=A0A8X6VVN9_TRICX|nr:hypothetical protein TNCV_3939561 [Trichonephila clavipes]